MVLTDLDLLLRSTFCCHLHATRKGREEESQGSWKVYVVVAVVSFVYHVGQSMQGAGKWKYLVEIFKLFSAIYNWRVRRQGLHWPKAGLYRRY